jgi:hypothetical protein
MALHPNFPESPYAIVDPAIRWFPADEALRETSMDKLMPPFLKYRHTFHSPWNFVYNVNRTVLLTIRVPGFRRQHPDSAQGGILPPRPRIGSQFA